MCDLVCFWSVVGGIGVIVVTPSAIVRVTVTVARGIVRVTIPIVGVRVMIPIVGVRVMIPIVGVRIAIIVVIVVIIIVRVRTPVGSGAWIALVALIAWITGTTVV